MEQVKTDITNGSSVRDQSAMSADREKLNKQIAMRKRIISVWAPFDCRTDCACEF